MPQNAKPLRGERKISRSRGKTAQGGLLRAGALVFPRLGGLFFPRCAGGGRFAGRSTGTNPTNCPSAAACEPQPPRQGTAEGSPTHRIHGGSAARSPASAPPAPQGSEPPGAGQPAPKKSFKGDFFFFFPPTPKPRKSRNAPGARPRLLGTRRGLLLPRPLAPCFQTLALAAVFF